MLMTIVRTTLGIALFVITCASAAAQGLTHGTMRLYPRAAP
jgi:hypothetical protein